MTVATANITDEVLHLPRASRAFLAEKLLESLDFDDAFPVSTEWMEEIYRRCQELDEGKVNLIPAGKVFADLDREFK
jgi:putative addiction module component (TIGR02574 family)